MILLLDQEPTGQINDSDTECQLSSFNCSKVITLKT